MMQFTPPAPIREDDDPFAHVFRTKGYLDGLWSRPPHYIEVRIANDVKYRFVTHPRMQNYRLSLRRAPLNSIFGIPLVVDESLPDGTYVVFFVEPGGLS